MTKSQKKEEVNGNLARLFDKAFVAEDQQQGLLAEQTLVHRALLEMKVVNE